MQMKVSVGNMWVTIFIEIMHVGVPVAIMHVVFSAVHYRHDNSIEIIQVTVSVVAVFVTVSSSNFIFLSLTNTHIS